MGLVPFWISAVTHKRHMPLCTTFYKTVDGQVLFWNETVFKHSKVNIYSNKYTQVYLITRIMQLYNNYVYTSKTFEIKKEWNVITNSN